MAWLTGSTSSLDSHLLNSQTAIEAGGWNPQTLEDMSAVLNKEILKEIDIDAEIVALLLETHFNENRWSLWNEKLGPTGSNEYYNMLKKIIEKNLLNKYNDVDKDYLFSRLDDFLKTKWLHLHRPSKVYSENNVWPNWDILEDDIVKYRVSGVK